MSETPNHAKGILLAAGGVVVLSPDSLLIRLIDLDLWTLGFLRGLFIAICLGVLLIVLSRGRPLQQFKDFDRPALGMAVLQAGGTLLFVLSIQTTSVAHTLTIVATIPILTAIAAYLILGEAVSRRTKITSVVVFLCLTIVVQDDGQSDLMGDLYALGASVAMAINFVQARQTRIKNLLAPVWLSGALIGLACLPLADVSQVEMRHIGLATLLGLCVGVSYAMLMMAPRYMEAAEVAVYLPLETIFGTLLVWLILHEVPGTQSLIGGAGVILALMVNSYLKMRRSPIGNAGT